jgi:quinolinate synthase
VIEIYDEIEALKLRMKRRLPRALTIAHPECPANIREHKKT